MNEEYFGNPGRGEASEPDTKNGEPTRSLQPGEGGNSGSPSAHQEPEGAQVNPVSKFAEEPFSGFEEAAEEPIYSGQPDQTPPFSQPAASDNAGNPDGPSLWSGSEGRSLEGDGPAQGEAGSDGGSSRMTGWDANYPASQTPMQYQSPDPLGNGSPEQESSASSSVVFSQSQETGPMGAPQYVSRQTAYGENPNGGVQPDAGPRAGYPEAFPPQSGYGQPGYGVSPEGFPAGNGAADGLQHGRTNGMDDGFSHAPFAVGQPTGGSSYGAAEPGGPSSRNPYAQGDPYSMGQPPVDGSYSPLPGQLGGMETSQEHPPKKKMDKGLKFFLWAVGIVLGGFVLAFSGYGIYSAVSGLPTGDNASSVSSSPSPGVSSSPQMNNNVPSGPATDPNWGGLELENQQQLNGGADTLSAAEIYEKQAPAIVGICVYNQGSQPGDDPAMEGSGIIISQNGYIMTNSHVVNDSNAFPVEVVLSTGDRYAATVVGYDKRTDLAVVKVEATGLPVATLGNADELRVGDWVLAIGNPGGLNYNNSLTRGIVSAINRSVESKAQTAMKYIQTDTAINPGNSGGALLNMYGQVIGINTAKIQGYEGMGFAIPITTAKKIVDDIIENGYVAGRVRLGLSGSIVSEYHARIYNLPQGVIIRSLTDDSDLVNKGVMEDDIITKINGKDVTSMDDIYDELANHTPGDTVKLTIFRSGTGMTKPTTFEVDVVLLEDKGETQQ